MSLNTRKHLLASAIVCGGLFSSAWAQVSNETGPVAADNKSADARMNRDDERTEKDYDKGKHDGALREHKGSHASVGVLRESFGVDLRSLQREQATSRELKPGVGLVVEDVTPSSVAANGGLQKGDIIFKVGDQWIINADQLATLLSIQDANNGFEIKVYRGTDRVDLDYKFDQTALDTMNRSLDSAMGSMDQSTDRTLDRTLKDRDRDQDRMAGANPMIIPEKFDFKDDLHSISIRTENGVKKLLVKDKDGNVLFDGPYNSAQDREAVPADVKIKVEQVLREKVK
jgi:hypothetical protein